MTRPLVAVLGGGQLGRMLGLAGIPLGIECRFLDPAGDRAPASAVGAVTAGVLDDVSAALDVARDAAVVTYEWEGVPVATAQAVVDAGHTMHPPPGALAVAQDRLAEKETFASLGIPTAPYRAVDDLPGLQTAIAALGTPAILKTRRGGYDGKGQVRIESPADADAAWRAIGGPDRILEGFVPFTRELSVLAVRGADGDTGVWPIVENRHTRGILRVSVAPAPDLGRDVTDAAVAIAGRVLDALDYVGVLAIELFEVPTPTGPTLVANEMAPRVHNSGHWTIEGAETSQFENHLRAILGLPLGATGARGASAMVNIVGAEPARDLLLAVPGTHWHGYDKAPRPGRKLAHVTITAPDAATRDERLAAVRTLSRDGG